VIIQGALGGTRVTESSTFLGIVHGVFAQAFFALLIVIAMATSRTWLSSEQPLVAKTANTDRTISAVLVGAILLQLTLGTWFRQIQPLPDIGPGLRMGLLHGHSFVGSSLVLVLVLFCGVRAWGMYANQRAIKRVGKGMVHTVALQVLLGITSFIIVPAEVRPQGEAIPTLEVAVTTAHQAVGAILLAMAVMHAVWVRRLLTDG
jgi:heme A synthase